MSSQLYKNCRILTIEFWNFVKEFMPVAKSTGRPGIPAYIVLGRVGKPRQRALTAILPPELCQKKLDVA